jgi:predicted transcriptional regulator
MLFHSISATKWGVFPLNHPPKRKNMNTAKEAAKQLIDHLPDEASWDDIMYELYVKQKIEEGLADIEAGHTIPHEQVKARILANW